VSSKRYEVSVQTTFAASHQLRGYKADIEPLHGHNFRVEAFVEARELDELGVVMDFIELEKCLVDVVAPYDHRHLNELPPFDQTNPTTENLARFFYGELEKKLPKGAQLRRVKVWEAPTYSAAYGEP
jgi:6-pyruvoyltetrahydropterin/6-carboxytetrahydropterin synthase